MRAPGTERRAVGVARSTKPASKRGAADARVADGDPGTRIAENEATCLVRELFDSFGPAYLAATIKADLRAYERRVTDYYRLFQGAYRCGELCG